ncbi:cysteine desulfurase [Heyndrickxia sporothermodurans]|nr:cysteine desulfurase [Heyndrickxia sporothermodurans]
MIYFDYSATTPIDSEALKVYQKISSNVFGNTSSLHDIGTKAEHVLQICRKELANLLSVSAEGVYFTSGGTESNLLSIISLAKSQSQYGKHIVTSIGEHDSIHSALSYLENDGFEISEIPFTQNGLIDLHALKKSIRQDTILISIQHVNSEIGTIQPIQEIAHLIKQQNILFHCDCVQSFGKLDISRITHYVDSVSVSSHKIYGPKGVGATYIDPSIHVKPLFPRLTHEHGFRGGTVNLPGIAAFITAAKKAQEVKHLKHYFTMRNLFLKELSKHKHFFTIYQSNDHKLQLPHIIGLGLNGIEGQYVMLECNRYGFAISTGSACHVGQHKPSNTMNALGIPSSKSNEFIRVSLGKYTKKSDVKELAALLNEIVKNVHVMLI